MPTGLRRRTRHHSPGEIAAKMALAETLGRRGKQNREIARELGVSVMTYQRWKRQVAHGTSNGPSGVPAVPPAPRAAPPLVAPGDAGEPVAMAAQLRRIAELERENARLRHLVASLLLDKTELQDRVGPVRATDGR